MEDRHTTPARGRTDRRRRRADRARRILGRDRSACLVPRERALTGHEAPDRCSQSRRVRNCRSAIQSGGSDVRARGWRGHFSAYAMQAISTERCRILPMELCHQILR